MDNKQIFINTINSSINEGKFIKLTLSKTHVQEAAKNVYGRLIELKKGKALSCIHRYATKDITKNYLIGKELNDELDNLIGNVFKIATLITENEEIVLQFNKKNQAVLNKKANTEQRTKKEIAHNLEKNYLITENTAFLTLLGVSSKVGNVLKEHRDKYRQINKYAEIMKSLIEKSKFVERNTPLQIVDMGSGKGYLTFALYYLLNVQMKLNLELLGVELRTELTDFCNEQSVELGWQNGLRFEAMDILSYNEGDIDILIALHACDVATDIAIGQGIKNGAEIIVVAPCCHKQIRKEMNPTGHWKEILKNGILLERQAELVTDALRALFLERAGYQTKVFEFISTQHTPKNIMITATKINSVRTEEEINAITSDIMGIKNTFGIKTHFLETLL